MNLRIVPTIDPNKQRQSDSYKFMTLLFMTLHIIFGFDVGFFSNKSLKFRLISNIIAFIHYVVLGVLLVLELRSSEYELNIDTFWAALYYFECLMCIVTLALIMRGKTFKNLQESLEEIDVKLQVDFSHKRTELKIILLLFLIYIQRVFVVGAYCSESFQLNCLNALLDNYVFIVISPCVDIALLCYSFVYYSLYLRLAKLVDKLKTCSDVVSIQYLYKIIIDTVEIYKNTFDPLFALLLITNTLKNLVAIYMTVKSMKNLTEMMTWPVLGAEYLHALHILAFTLAPALTAEMLTTQAEKLKTILNDRRLYQSIQQKDTLTRFIQYVEARPCRFHVWKLIPLGADLPGMVLSFCVTYLIVIIQFTNQ